MYRNALTYIVLALLVLSTTVNARVFVVSGTV
jgi:hypothetical protein